MWIVSVREKVSQNVYITIPKNDGELGNFLLGFDSDFYELGEITKVYAQGIEELKYFLKKEENLELGGEKC